MLKDELTLLAEWAVNILAALETNSSITKTNDLEKRISTECQRIKKVWTDFLLNQPKEAVIKRYVAFQQQIIVELADQLFGAIQRGRMSDLAMTDINFQQADKLLNCLLNLKDFQVQYFNVYIDENGKIPDAAIVDVRRRLSDAAEQLSAGLQEVEMDLGLKACIRDYLSPIIGAEVNAPLNYRTAEYILSFIETVEATTSFEDDRDLTHAVIEVLFYLNFNQSGFCHWYEENLISKKQLVRPADQPFFMNKQMLTLKSLQVNTKINYDPKLAPVNSQLENWLSEFTKQETFPFELSDNVQIEKLELKLTVAQMALLIRLLYDEGVFAIKNIAAIIRFFSAHYTSKKQENISSGNMNKLYYTSDQFTAAVVKDLLIKMVARVNKMFFPT
ncbi:hypothetical protein [Mucilaginibacter terrae]|uniref:Uncharacterized protein n=1 Tax=Mucilaginibacter terrae TaxID=1955052 RepID=A0ABU3GMM7_9SPHI|nr:hypothetical protein [Mucilaginibacter terrae]MDT3401040.1 hypothetical protein [Mucilaginibacter terrae]